MNRLSPGEAEFFGPRARAAQPRRDANARLWRRWRSALLLFVFLLSLVGAAFGAIVAWRAKEANRAIDALVSGRDVDVGPNAAPELLAARIGFLASRGEVDRARALIETLDARNRVALSATAHYGLANALLRKAFALLEHGELEPAGPLINLARRDYRRALQFDPQFWNAKYNLDVASRLIRDYPEFERSSGDELPADPKKIWTDIPGAPKGLP